MKTFLGIALSAMGAGLIGTYAHSVILSVGIFCLFFGALMLIDVVIHSK
jgi:hypothetical protein